MSRRALLLAALGGGFRTWLVPHITLSHPDPLLQEGAPEKPSWPGPQTQTTDHRPRVPLGMRQPTFGILGRVRGGSGCSSTASHDDRRGGNPPTPSPPGSTPPEQNKMENETQRQAQKDIKPNIYTKYYSFWNPQGQLQLKNVFKHYFHHRESSKERRQQPAAREPCACPGSGLATTPHSSGCETAAPATITCIATGPTGPSKQEGAKSGCCGVRGNCDSAFGVQFIQNKCLLGFMETFSYFHV